MCASIFYREAREYGAMWHGCDWSTHTVLGSDPWDTNKGKSSSMNFHSRSLDEWEWELPRPTDWRPYVIEKDDSFTIFFYTHIATSI